MLIGLTRGMLKLAQKIGCVSNILTRNGQVRNGQVDETTNQAVIGGRIKKEGTIGVLELKMLLHRKVSRERTMLANIRENVQKIFALVEKNSSR